MPDFSIKPLSASQKESIMTRTEWSERAPVDLDRIVSIGFLHQTFDGRVKKGEVHMHELCAEQLLDVFRKLFVIEFPIHSAIPVDSFDGDDVKSMNANNSSGFNPRKVMHTDRWSSHAYGFAIDINPVQNPYVLNPGTGNKEIYPIGGDQYLKRKDLRKGMVESVVSFFKSSGFDVWGGDWESPLDYHHFQVDWELIQELI